MEIDKRKIHAALAEVHLSEKSSGNPDGLPRLDAARRAAVWRGLNTVETDILFNALALPPEPR